MREIILYIFILICPNLIGQRRITYNIDIERTDFGSYIAFDKPFVDWYCIHLGSKGEIYFEKIIEQTRFDNCNRVHGKWYYEDGLYKADFFKDSCKMELNTYHIEFFIKKNKLIIQSDPLLGSYKTYENDYLEWPEFQHDSITLRDTIFNGHSFNYYEIDKMGRLSTLGNYKDGFAHGFWMIRFFDGYSYGNYKYGFKNGWWTNEKKTYKKLYRNKKLIKTEYLNNNSG
jgi:hypothetical protein